MEKILLLHGYNGIPKIFYWLKQELENMGYMVIMPNLPIQEGVRYNGWKTEFESVKNKLKGEITVVAHSIGNSFLIKYLKQNKLNIKLYIGLAGFSNIYEAEGKKDLNDAIRDMQPLQEEIDYFKSKVKSRYCIYSNDDHIVPLEILEKHVQNIDATSFLIPKIGHMGRKSNLQTIPKVIEIIRNEKITSGIS